MPWETLHRRHALNIKGSVFRAKGDLGGGLYKKVQGSISEYETMADKMWKNEAWIRRLYGVGEIKHARQRFLDCWILGMPTRIAVKAKKGLRKITDVKGYGMATVADVYDYLRKYIDNYEAVMEERAGNGYSINAVAQGVPVEEEQEDWRGAMTRERRDDRRDNRRDDRREDRREERRGDRRDRVRDQRREENPRSERKSQRPCREGASCNRPGCWYSHAGDCRLFVAKGSCRFGSECKFAHPTAEDLSYRKARERRSESTPNRAASTCLACKKDGRPYNHKYFTCEHYVCKRCATPKPGHTVRQCTSGCPSCGANAGASCPNSCGRPTFRLRAVQNERR